MNNVIIVWIVVVTVILVSIVCMIYLYLLLLKRQMRTGELIHKIDVILEEGGCNNADNLLTECVHLIDHYNISLLKLNFRKMITIEELKHATLASMERYHKRMLSLHEKTYAEYKTLMDIPPEKRSSDQKSRYAQLREMVTNFGGELNSLCAKINALKAELGS